MLPLIHNAISQIANFSLIHWPYALIKKSAKIRDENRLYRTLHGLFDIPIIKQKETYSIIRVWESDIK